MIGEWVQHACSSRALHFHRTGPALFGIRQHAAHALAGDSQELGDAALRCTAVVQADDLVARRLLHARSNSPTKSWLSVATDPASRASLWKRGNRIARSSSVSPVRPWCANHTSMRPSTSSSIPTRFHTWLPASLSRGSRTEGSTPLACERASRGCARRYSCWRRSEHRSHRSTTPPNSALDSASRRRFQHFRLVALRQPHNLPRCRGRQQFVFRLWSQTLDQRQPPAHPTLVAAQQLCHLHLAQAVFPHQRLDDPGFFQFPRAAPGTIQTVDRRFRLTLIGHP